MCTCDLLRDFGGYTWVQSPLEGRSGFQIPWSRSERWCESFHMGTWKQTMKPWSTISSASETHFLTFLVSFPIPLAISHLYIESEYFSYSYHPSLEIHQFLSILSISPSSFFSIVVFSPGGPFFIWKLQSVENFRKLFRSCHYHIQSLTLNTQQFEYIQFLMWLIKFSMI